MILTPYVLTTSQNLPLLHQLDAFPDILTLLVDDPTSKPFADLLNYTNQLAFGGDTNMGMPLWVMLDCGILSSAIIGFATSREQLPSSILEKLNVPDTYHDLIPISEYCACPTLTPHQVSGFSLQSQVPHLNLGLRTKALAMLLYGATSQIGVTQLDNPAIRVHSKLGPLKLLIHRPVVHTHAHKSFVYELTLPHHTILKKLADGLLPHAPQPTPSGTHWSFDPAQAKDHERLSNLLKDQQPVMITSPGWHQHPDGRISIDMCLLD